MSDNTTGNPCSDCGWRFGDHSINCGISAPKNDPTIGRIVGWLDEEMAELSRLHLAYEEAHVFRYIEGSTELIEAGDELSAAVGKFLVTRGYEGRI